MEKKHLPIVTTLHGERLEPLIKALVATPAEGENIAGVVYPPVDLQQILQLSHSNAFHSTCIELKASMTVGIEYEAPVQVEKFLEDVSGDTPFLELLQQAIYDWEGLGNGYLEIARSKKGRQIGELGHVHGHTVFAVQEGNRLSEYWQETASASTQKFAPFGEHGEQNELFHFRRYTPLSSFYGLPSWIAALEALRLDQEKKVFYSSFFRNNAVPSMAIVLQGAEFDAGTEAVIRDGLRETKGAENAHKTILLSVPFDGAEIKFHMLSSDLKDMPFDKLSQATREEILAAHAVPPRLVGIVTAGQLGGGGEAEGQLQIFNETSIKPRMAYVERRVKRLLRDAGQPEEFKLKGITPTPVSLEKETDGAVDPAVAAVMKSLSKDWD